jgi:soluble P-type ATPase
MIEIAIPGYTTLQLRHLVLDSNGTIAKDGFLIQGVPELLRQLQTRLEIHIITADTHGKQNNIDKILQLQSTRIGPESQKTAKLNFISTLGASKTVAIGNGANDSDMLKNAALGIVILGPEGAAVETLINADVVVTDIRAGLELLLYPGRLIATLRR